MTDKSPMQIMPDGTIQPVITLRDQFAMATLTGLITKHGDEGSKAAAEISYRYADAMMKAREEK